MSNYRGLVLFRYETCVLTIINSFLTILETSITITKKLTTMYMFWRISLACEEGTKKRQIEKKENGVYFMFCSTLAT